MRLPSASSVEMPLAHEQALADEIETCTVTPLFLIWRCQAALLVSRTETRLPHFKEACLELASAGWPIFVRKSGGGACPLGCGTVQISTIEVATPDATMNGKYAFVAEIIQATLRTFRIESYTGCVVDAYCPGRFDIAVAGKKIAGVAQRWFRNSRGVRCITTVASINVEEAPEDLAGVVTRFYSSAGSSHCCLAGALTNMRLCGAKSPPACRDLTGAVMTELAAHAQILGATG